jgi:hypothetical protein
MSQDACINTTDVQDAQPESEPRHRRWRRHIPHLIFAAVGIGGGVAVALGGVEAVFTAIGRPAPAIPNNFRTGMAASWLMLWLGCEWMISSVNRANAKLRSMLVSTLVSVGLAVMVGALALVFAK